MFRTLAIAGSIVFLAGCTFHLDKSPRGPAEYSGGDSRKAGAVAGFEEVSAKVLKPRCAECHVEFDGYAAVRSALGDIRSLVASNVMPKNRPMLSEADKAYLFAWIDAGAPEFASANPSPAPGEAPPATPVPSEPPPVLPPPVEEPLTFAVVKERVFAPRCARCHGTRAGVNLDTYANTMRDLTRIKDSIESGRMPLGAPLSDEQKQLLLRWIAIGAPET